MGLNQKNMQIQLMQNMGNISIDRNEIGMRLQQMINLNQQMKSIIDGPNIKEDDERKSNNSDEINVCFIAEGYYNIKPNQIYIQCLKSERVSDVIQRYRNKSGDFDCSKKFIFNAKQLNTSLLVCEAEITENANIFVKSTKGIKGAGCAMMFSDVSKNKTKEIFFSKSAPSYRKAGKGINIFGICHCKKCKAFNKEVVIPIKKKI